MQTIEKTERLSRQETEELQKLEDIIREGLDNFQKTGTALLRVRDARLYREEFSNFEDYCKTRWQMSGGNAYRLIRAAAVAENCCQLATLPPNESQCRELESLPAEEQAPAYAEAVAMTKGKPTAAIVRQVVEKRKGVVTAETEVASQPEDEQERKREYQEHIFKNDLLFIEDSLAMVLKKFPHHVDDVIKFLSKQLCKARELSISQKQ